LSFVGLLLLGSGFLYARLRGLFRGETAASVGALLLLALGSVGHVQAAEPKSHKVAAHLYRTKATIDGIGDAGDYRLAVDRELYLKSLAVSALADLRIADEEGREVPFVLRVPPTHIETRTFAAHVLDPGAIDGGGYRATFE